MSNKYKDVRKIIVIIIIKDKKYLFFIYKIKKKTIIGINNFFKLFLNDIKVCQE